MILVGTGHQRAAKSSRVEVNGQILTYSSYQTSAVAADLPTPNFTSFIPTAYSADGIQLGQSYDEGIQGILSSNGNFGGDWDAGTNPLDVNAPPGLYPRDNLTNLQFWTSTVDGVFWNYPYARIRTAQNSGAVDGKVAFVVSDFKNQGQFTFPVGSV